MPITLEQAKALTYRDVLHTDRDCTRWRVNGKVKRWKRDPDRVLIPVKYGLYGYARLDNEGIKKVHLESECPHTKRH